MFAALIAFMVCNWYVFWLSCLCVVTFGNVLGRYCEFSKRIEFYFVIGLLIIVIVKFIGICKLYFICQFCKWQMFKSFIPGCIIGHFYSCEIFRNFPPGMRIFVVCWQFILSKGSVVLHIGNCFFCGGCRIIDINNLSCWIVQGFVSFFVKLYVTCTFYSSQAEILCNI